MPLLSKYAHLYYVGMRGRKQWLYLWPYYSQLNSKNLMNGSSYIIKQMFTSSNEITLVSRYVCSNSPTNKGSVYFFKIIDKFRMWTCAIFTGLLFLCMI